jgi:hypothetical protein
MKVLLTIMGGTGHEAKVGGNSLVSLDVLELSHKRIDLEDQL